MMRYAAVLLALLMGTSLSAQQTVKSNQPLSLSFDHNGQNTDGYRFKLDSAPLGADLPKSQLVNSTLIKTVSGVPDGPHTLAACAFNVAGESCVTLAVVGVSAPPSAPTSFTVTVVVTVAQDGTVSFKVADAQAALRFQP